MRTRHVELLKLGDGGLNNIIDFDDDDFDNDDDENGINNHWNWDGDNVGWGGMEMEDAINFSNMHSTLDACFTLF